MRLKTMLAALAAVGMLTACEDIFEDGNMQPDGSKPSVVVNSPSSNQAINVAQGLLVNISAVDKDKVKDLDIVLQSQEEEQNTLISFSTTPDKNVVEFDSVVSVQGVKPGRYNLIITATDYRTNQTVQEVPVIIQAPAN
ncbi:hypothetical protein [Pontibacter akesuensis]|nr:hypothetical protein [Pontibacter akesuensis]